MRPTRTWKFALLFSLLLAAGCGFYYTVEKGDTLYSIAKKYEVSPEQIMEENKISDPRKLKIGQKLRIPRLESETHKKTAGKGADKVKDPKTPDDADKIKAPKDKTQPPVPNAPVFIWPVKGVVTRAFGKDSEGRSNDGIDIAAPEGAKVVAAADGEVYLVTDKWPAYGNLVVVQHSNEYVTLYAYNRGALVVKGMKVTKGQAIAEVGSTGRAKTPMLHFEIRLISDPIDPMKFLPPQ